MSFKPQGASLPAKFKKQGSNGNFKARPKDLLVVIDAYNLNAKTISVTDANTQRKYELRINPEKANAATGRTSADKWSGNVIDERMQKSLPVGHLAVIERSIVEKVVKNATTGDVSIGMCNWVIAPTDPSPEKTFRGNLTFSKWENRIIGVQHWEEKSIDPTTAEGEKAIEDLIAKLDDINAKRANGERVTPLGVQFSTLVETGVDKDNNPTYECIDMSPPFDWIQAEKDADQKVIKEGHPLDGEHLENYLNGYMDYVLGSQDQDADDAEPGLIASGVVAPDKTLRVEVSVYRALTAAPRSERMELGSERSPLYRLANTMTKYGLQDDVGFVGKNIGVDGIAMLIADAAPKDRNGEWEQRDLVGRVFTTGYTAHIRSLIKASDGGRVRVHPALDRARDDAPAPAAPASATGVSAPASGAPVLLEPAPVSLDDADGDDGAGYFSQAVAQSIEPPTAEASAPVATAPAAEPAADKTGKDAGKGRSNRFQRKT